MTISIRQLAAATLAAWLWPLVVAAQVSAPTAPAPIHRGPLFLYPTIDMRNVGTDSNVFDDFTDPKEDFTFTMNPRLIAVLRLGVAQLTALSSNDFVFYRTYKSQQGINKQLGVRLDFPFSRLKPFVSAERLITRDRLNLEIDARARRTERNVMAGLDVELTAITALTLSARADDSLFAKGETFRGVELGDVLDRKGRSAIGGLKFAVTPFTTLLVTAEVEQDRFSGSNLRDSDSIQAGLALQFSADAAITGNAAVGYRVFKPVNQALAEHRGLVVAVGVGYSLLGITTFDVQASRDVMYSFEDTAPYYLSTGGSLTVTQHLFGPLDLVVNGQRQHLAYQPLTTTSEDGRVDTVDTYGGGFRVRVGTNLRLGFTGERTTRHSTSPGQQEYERTRLLGSVTLGS